VKIRVLLLPDYSDCMSKWIEKKKKKIQLRWWMYDFADRRVKKYGVFREIGLPGN
jgi:uncharacterized protein (DUF2344 family)